jgi:serine/threonine-protein kinase
VLTALEAAHGANIIHRDIKPANVFLVRGATGSAAVRVLDFGIAKFQETADGAKTSTGAVLGSAYYMAPEQVRAESDIDARADVWGVGATLYELLVGEPAHMAPTHAAVIAKIVMKPAPAVTARRPDGDAKLDELVARALALAPADRFPSAAAMREAIETYLVERAATVISVPPPSLSLAAKALRTANASASSGGETPRAVVAGATDLRPLGTTESPARPRSLLPLAAAALAIGVIGTIAVVSRTADAPPASPEAKSAAATTPPALAPAPAPASASALASASASALASASASALASASASAPSASSPSPARHASPPQRCAPTEILSDGHCCPRGFIWRDDRCERDIAVVPPF